MAYIAINENGDEAIFEDMPVRSNDSWVGINRYHTSESDKKITLPKGTASRLVGYQMSWQDEPKRLIHQIDFEL